MDSYYAQKGYKFLSKNSTVMTIRIVVRCSCFYEFLGFEIKKTDRRLLAAAPQDFHLGPC